MPSPSAPADRNLLFGLLALQSGLATRDQLIEAMHAWMLERDTPLGDLLCRRGVLDGDDQADIEKLVGKHLKRHGGDPQASIAALPLGPDYLLSIVGVFDTDGQTLTLRPGATSRHARPRPGSGTKS